MRRGGGWGVTRRALLSAWAAITLYLPAPAVTLTVTGWAAVRQVPAIASFRRQATTAGGLWSGRTLAVGVALLAKSRAVSVGAPLPCPAGALRMSDVASLPIDPEAGSLADKIPAELDRSRLRHVSSVPAGMTPAVLVACGSYSPPTVLHTRIFETARDFFKENQELLKVDVIGGFVSPVHAAYGKKGLAPMEDRLAMVKLALESSDWVSCDDWETRQNEWTRTRLSLDRMHIEVNKGNGGGKEVQVMLLCGADILDSMVTPGVWMESDLHAILSRGLVCIKRSGSDPEKVINNHDVLYKYRQKIFLIREWVENNVSSTAVRRAVKRGLSVKYFVADGVADHIKKSKLYTE